MPNYQQHLFFCTNQKDPGKSCCAEKGGAEAWQYAKQRCREEGLLANEQVRVNRSGCLGQCAKGPCLVIYPQGHWYRYNNHQDIDRIIEAELMDGETVPELRLTEDE